ncbi:hypothetical protein [Bosea lupini]|uniref:hypothetical protein n=1 Tax=Bosea lupini TaxID=1036779 RepID=UPI001160A9BA|nr:hypothetical protein [Bosea lupini]
MFPKIVVLGGLALPLAGCGHSPAQVADPNSITLEDAVFDVARSLHRVRDHYRNREKIGLGVSEATVTFNISASSENKSTLKIEAAAGESAGFPLSGLFQNERTTNGTRGNQITIKFAPASGKTVLLAKKKDAASGASVTPPFVIFGEKLSPEDAKRLQELLRGANPQK